MAAEQISILCVKIFGPLILLKARLFNGSLPTQGLEELEYNLFMFHHIRFVRAEILHIIVYDPENKSRHL
jgi:hypothetical protein